MKLAAIVLPCTLLSSFLHASPEITTQSQSLVEAYHDAGKFDGVALVAQDGEPVLITAIGVADRSWETALTTDACFPIASLTKQFTAVLVLDAAQRGELQLDDTLGKIFPSLTNEQTKSTKVRDLLLHAGGFTDPPLEHYLDPRRTLMTDLQIVREFLFNQIPDFTPGTQFRYSNADYHWLGAILETRSGKTFAQLVNERIAQPAGLVNTRIANRAEVRANRPNDYVQQAGVGWINPPAYQWSNWQAAGGLESTLDDLHAWNLALARNTILTPESTAMMLTVPEVPGNYVALGTWSYKRLLPGTDVTLNIGERRGAIGGFAVLNAFDLEREQWVILLSNHANRTLDTLSYAPCLPLDLFTTLHQGTPTGPPALADE